MVDPRWKLPDGFDDDVRKALRNLLFALRNAYKSIPSTAWEQLRLGNLQAFMDLIDWSSFRGDLSEFQEILRDAAKRAGDEVLNDGDIALDYAFDLVDARALDFAYNRSSQLITLITDEAKANIRKIIGDATNGEMTYFQAGQRIRSHIGLTERDTGAVDKFRNRTFERFMQQGLSEAKAREKAEQKAAQYADKLLRRRAETISRTELADAASTGRYNGWQTGVEQGLIDNASVKEWLAEPTACPICEGFTGKKIPWNAEFAEGIKMSPAHPNCRCRVVILPPDYAEEVYTTKKSSGWDSVVKALEDTYKPTEGMKTAARRALRWKDEGKATGAGTPVGWGRATDIVAGRSMSLSVVKRMYSFFSRHEVDKKGKDFDNISNPSNGRIMWDAWGGDAGFTWSRAIVERNRDVNKHLAGKHDQSTHAGGHSTARPYELKPNLNERVRWDYDTYQAGQWVTDGPTSKVLAASSDGFRAEARLRTAYVINEKVGSYTADKDAYDSLRQDLLNDPDYPRLSDNALRETAESFQWYRDRVARDGLTWEEYKVKNPQDLPQIVGQTLSNMPEADRMAFLVKENAWVENKLMNGRTLSGERVGDVIDKIASGSLDQLASITRDETVSLAMPAGRLKKFIEDDHYKTVYETTRNNKGGSRENYMDARMSWEARMGVPDNIPNSKRPVSGILGSGNVFGKDAYGETKVIFKEDIKHRTTITLGDSLDGFSKGAYWMSDLAEQKVTPSTFWKTNGGNVQYSIQNEYNPAWSRTSDKSQRVVSYKNNVRDLTWGGNGYIETQIHGGVSLADVAKIIVPKSTTLPAATRTMLADKGIVVEVDSSLSGDK